MALTSQTRGDDVDIDALEEQVFQQAVAAAERSVVRIETVGGVDLVGEVLTATGPTTGLIVSDDGYIITSRFNFLSRPTSIIVSLPDERKLPAKIVAEDLSRMLTLLRVEATGLVPLDAVPTSELQIGQWAIALGRTLNPQFPNLSVGIVSATERLHGRAVQTDAKVSPLNYGGPLIDVSGRGIGVLVPLSPQGEDETAGVEWYDSGIGFAIPLAEINAALPRLKQGETLHKGLLGIGFADDSPLAGEAKVGVVRPESPADKAGMLVGDVITAVDEVPVTRVPLLRRAMGKRYAGETVRLTVQRGEDTLNLTVTLAAELKPYAVPYLGILPSRTSQGDGVTIRQVVPDSPAATAQLQSGDVLLKLADTPITTQDLLIQTLRTLAVDSECPIELRRQGASLTVTVKLAEFPHEFLSEVPPVVRPQLGEVANRPAVGRISETLAGRDLKYWAYVPETYHPQQPLGLLIWLHPAGAPLEAELLRLCQEQCDKRGVLLLGPQASNVAGWTADDTEAVLDLIRHVQSVYTIDPYRIATCGLEEGAGFALHVALKDRQLVKGTILSNGVYRGSLPDNDPDFRFQLLTIGFAEDDSFPLVDKMTVLLRNMKYPTSHLALPGSAAQGLNSQWAESVLLWLDALDRL